MAEVLTFSAGSEVVRLYRYHTLQAPLWTVTSENVSETSHDELDKVFHHLFNRGHVHLELRASAPCADGPLKRLQSFLTQKLFSAFEGTPIEHLECHVTCAQVTVGGYGATWHSDATSQLTFRNNQVCEYLALYYLEPHQVEKSHHWLECVLGNEPCISSFIPVSTQDHSLLILRNDLMLHRTPLLSNLIRGQMRRFFYIPFRALDLKGEPILLKNPIHTTIWQPFSHASISSIVLHELKKHNIDISLEDYIEGKEVQQDTIEEVKSERNNWLFKDPDDY